MKETSEGKPKGSLRIIWRQNRGIVNKTETNSLNCHELGPKSQCLIYGQDRATLAGMTVHTPAQFQKKSRFPQEVHFDRKELGTILGLYGRMVAAGEWRDYGISSLREVAVFSVFRRTAERPLYRIEKHPKLRNKQGLYSVIGMDGQILKRGHDLKTVLRVLERKLIRIVE